MNSGMTTICVPTEDDGGLLSDISIHFGKAPYLTFITLENGEIKEINVSEGLKKDNGYAKTPIEIILEAGTDVLICGCLGEKDLSLLGKRGIEIFLGASGRVRDTIKEWKIGFLPISDEIFCKNSCKEL